MKFAATFAAAAVAFVATALSAPTEKRDTHFAQGTWYTQNGNPGSCGAYNDNNAMIVAVSAEHHDSSNCFKWITIEANGVQQAAQIADTCPGCGYYDLDLSQGLFEKFADLSTGEINIAWWANW